MKSSYLMFSFLCIYRMMGITLIPSAVALANTQTIIAQKFDRLHVLQHSPLNDNRVGRRTCSPPLTSRASQIKFMSLQSFESNPEDKSNNGATYAASTTSGVRRRLARMATNFWYVLTIPFPELRRLARKRIAHREASSSALVISPGFKETIIGLALYFGLGVVTYHQVFESFSLIDSLYYTCVCFSTVGYVYKGTVVFLWSSVVAVFVSGSRLSQKYLTSAPPYFIAFSTVICRCNCAGSLSKFSSSIKQSSN